MDSFILRMTKNIISEEINERLKNVQNKIVSHFKLKNVIKFKLDNNGSKFVYLDGKSA